MIMEVQQKFSKINQPYLELLYKTILLLGYYGMLRISEMTKTKSGHAVKAKNIHSATNKNKILIVLYSSKTHGKSSRPQEIKISQLNQPGANEQSTCPFKTTNDFLEMRGDYEDEEEQLFIFRDGSPVSAQNVRNVLKECLSNLGLDPTLYGTHSLRSGRATDMQQKGKHIDEIKKCGRWRSNAVYKYIK